MAEMAVPRLNEHIFVNLKCVSIIFSIFPVNKVINPLSSVYIMSSPIKRH
jgi:hypothetical protein